MHEIMLKINGKTVSNNVPSNFLKSLCVQNFMCSTFFQHPSLFRTPYMKYVQTRFLQENLCVLQVFVCAFVSQPARARICAQLGGNIGLKIRNAKMY